VVLETNPTPRIAAKEWFVPMPRDLESPITEGHGGGALFSIRSLSAHRDQHPLGLGVEVAAENHDMLVSSNLS
jgi:hypothetical protein